MLEDVGLPGAPNVPELVEAGGGEVVLVTGAFFISPLAIPILGAAGLVAIALGVALSAWVLLSLRRRRRSA